MNEILRVEGKVCLRKEGARSGGAQLRLWTNEIGVWTIDRRKRSQIVKRRSH